VTEADRVVAYHGTTTHRAKRLLSDGFIPSQNEHDWLGRGTYFFERAPRRAYEWAVEKIGRDGLDEGEPCVIRACVSLVDCLDLTDTVGTELVRPWYNEFAAAVGEELAATLKQGPRVRQLDRAVIDFAVPHVEEFGYRVASVRCAFAEGEPVWTSPSGQRSGILDRNHVQIAVRHPAIIKQPCLVDTPRLGLPGVLDV